MNILCIILQTIFFTVKAQDWILHNNGSCAEADNIVKMTTVNSTLSTLSVCKRACSGVYTDTCSHVTHMQNDTECQLSSQCTPEVSQESDYYDININAADDIATEVGSKLDTSVTCKLNKATGIIFVGCFSDTEPHDMPYSAANLDPDSMTVDGCLEECDRQGYIYAGLQLGSQCWCGNSYGTYGETTGCSYACTGNSEQYCGRNLRNSIYKYSYDYGKVYLGCYTDAGTRDLPVYKGRPDSATNDVCMDLCTQEGYVYSATQDRSACFCGDKYGLHGNRVDESFCNYPCPGNSQQTCGGSWKNSIYADFGPIREPSGDVMYKVEGLNSNSITAENCAQLCWNTDGCEAVVHKTEENKCFLINKCLLVRSEISDNQAILVGYNSSAAEFTDRNFSTCVTVSKNTNIPFGRPWYKDYMVSANFSVSVVGTNMTCDSTQGLQNNIYVLHKSLKHNTASDESQVYRKCTMNGSESTVNSQHRCAFTCTCEDLCDTLYVKTVGQVQPTICEVYGQ